MSRKAFEEAVTEALDSIPRVLQEAIQNLAVTVEDEPSDEDLLGLDMDPEEETLFGLYVGTPLTERGPTSYGEGLPDRVIIYRLPLLEHCDSRRQLLREIRNTVIHEIGHYFGFEDEDLP